jgi:hypothetical protein
LIRVTEAIAAGGTDLFSSTTWFLAGVLRALQNGIKPISWDKRKAKRVHFDHKCRAGTWRRDCILIDVSGTGARLRIDGSTDMLKARQFFLLLSSTGLAFRRCELVKLDGPEVGVHFVTSRTVRARPEIGEKKPNPPSN